MSKTVFAAVLAAGHSRRFGSAKQLQEWDGEPLVGHALEIATGACGSNVLLVLGHQWREVMAAARDAPFLAFNEQHERGMGTSIATAAQSLRNVADAIIVMPVDQPLVTSDHLRSLINTWSGDDEEIVASYYSDLDGTPALFPRGAFDGLAQLAADKGARTLFGDARFRVQSVTCEEAAFDIDTPDDLEQRSQFTQPESPST